MQNISYKETVPHEDKPTQTIDNVSLLHKRSHDDHLITGTNGSPTDSDNSLDHSPTRKHHKKTDRYSDKKHKRKEKQHKKKEKHRQRTSKASSTTSQKSISYKPSTIWLDETNRDCKDGYWLDSKPDSSNFTYDTLYTGDQATYRRYFGNFCLGLGKHQVIKFTDNRNLVSKKKKQSPVTRYYIDDVSDLSDTTLLLGNQGVRIEGALQEAEEFLMLEQEVDDDNESHISRNITVSPESFLMQQASQYNTLLLHDPHDVQLWLEFIHFQDEALVWGKLPGPAVQLDTEEGTRHESQRRQQLAVIERKVAIYEKALESNPLSEELIVGHMELVQEVWETERLVKRWKDVVFKQPNKSQLWLKYIEFCQTRFSFYRSSSITSLYQKAISTLASILDRVLLSHKPEHEAEKCLLAIFLLYCYFLRQSGFLEKAVASFQALIEFNIFLPEEALAHHDTRHRLEFFEIFWDSSVPRIGEDGAVGWKRWWKSRGTHSGAVLHSLGVVKMENYHKLLCEEKKELGREECLEEKMEGDMKHEDVSNEEEEMDVEGSLVQGVPPNMAWSKLECHREQTLCLPLRLGEEKDQQEEMAEDPDHIILFDDISPCMFVIRDSQLQLQLVLEFLRFLGAPVSSTPFLPSIFPNLAQIITSPQEVMNPLAMPNLTSLGDITFSPLLYQPSCIGSDLDKVSNYSVHTLLCDHSRSSSSSAMPLASKYFISRMFNQSLSCFKTFGDQNAISHLTYCWLQYELNILTKSKSQSDTEAMAVHLQSLAIYLIQDVPFKDFHTLWNFTVMLEHVLAIKKKPSALSKELLTPFADHSNCTIDSVYNMCQCFVEYMLGLRKPMNCYARHKPDKNLALFALVSLSSSTFNPTLLPVSDVRVSPAQILKASKYFQKLTSSLVSSLPSLRYADINFVFGKLACHVYFEYICKGIKACCELQTTLITPLIEKAKDEQTIYPLLEALYILQVNLIENHSLTNPIKPQLLRDTLKEVLQLFPTHFWFLQTYVQSEKQSFITGQLRRFFNSTTIKNDSVVIWLFAIQAEVDRHYRLTHLTGEFTDESKSGMLQRIRALFARATQSSRGQFCPVLWRLYIKFEVRIFLMKGCCTEYYMFVASNYVFMM